MLVVRPRLRTLVAVLLSPLIIAFTCLRIFRLAPDSQFQPSAHTVPYVLNAGAGGGWAIAPELGDYARRVLAAEHVPGLSVAAVRITDTGEVETDLAAWGYMNEDGERTTADEGHTCMTS